MIEMRSVYFGTLLVALFPNCYATNDICDGLEDGTRVPSNLQCDSFIICKGQRIFSVGRCPRGLHFNRRLAVCDLKRRARCDGALILPNLDIRSETRECSSDCCGCCNCCNSTPIPSACSDARLVPVISSPSGVPSTGPSGTTCNKKGVCENQPDGAMFPDPSSNGYIVCQCECEIPMPCPEGLTFNPVLKVCDWAKSSTGTPSTKSTTSTSVTTSTPSDSSPLNTSSSPIGTTPSDTSSTSINTTPLETTSTPIGSSSPGTSSTPTDSTTLPTPSTPSSPATGPSGTTCNKKGVCDNQPDGAIFPDPSSNGYIVCQCECEIPMPCPEGLTFNTVLKVCDWPKSSTGTPNTISTRSTTLPTPSTPSNPATGPSGTTCNNKGVCDNQPDGAMFPDPSSNGYIVCQCECEIPMPCPEGLTFNTVLKVCDWPKSSTGTPNTISTRSTSVTTSTPSDSSPLDTSSSPIGATPSDTSSTSINTTPLETTSTPIGSSSPGTSSTPTDSTTLPTPSTPSSPATGPSGTTCNKKGVCDNQPDGAMFPDPSSNGYIVCQCECEIPMPCPEGLTFNTVLKVCDWPKSSTGTPNTISTRSTTLPTPSTPSNPATGPSGTTCNNKGVCDNQPDGAMFPDPSSNGYIVCQCECEMPMPCPEGLTFNLVLKVCDWPKSSTGTPNTISTRSTTLPTPSTPSSPATGPSGTTCNNKGVCDNQPDGAMFPDPSSNGYIVCQCECEIPMPCPEGLTFNPVLKVCDWPRNIASTGSLGTACNKKGKCEGQQDGTLFADPDSSGYIMCERECEVPRLCPNGLAFNPNVMVCDWPQVYV